MKKHLYIIAYDIAQNKRRTKLAQILEDRGGERVNYSVFEIMLKARQHRNLLRDIQELIKPKTDKVLIYPICLTCYSKANHIPEEKQEAVNPVVSL